MGRQRRVEIQLENISSPQQLHQLLRDKLGFPAFYGCNWDAFWDAITGLVEMPFVIQFSGWAHFEASLPKDSKLLRECFSKMQQEYPNEAAEVVYA